MVLEASGVAECIAGIPVFVEIGFVLLVLLVFVVAKDASLSRLQIGLPLAVSLMLIMFIGNPITALLISVFFAYFSLGLARGVSLDGLLSITERSFTSIAGIFLIIGAGGAFNKVFIVSVVGEGLKNTLSTLSVSPIILAWLIAALLHFAVGSATVAMISAAGIVLPMLRAHPEISPEVMAIALTQVSDSFSGW